MKISLGDYESEEKQVKKVNSPKSLESCRRSGVLPSDLMFVGF